LSLAQVGDKISVLQIFYRYGLRMNKVTISPKYQVVIPQAIRKSLGLQPGQKVQAILYENRIELIPIKPIQSMRGFLKGIDTSIERTSDRI
jgi:AbrB family looped-hinge helix DNA binding protein